MREAEIKILGGLPVTVSYIRISAFGGEPAGYIIQDITHIDGRQLRSDRFLWKRIAETPGELSDMLRQVEEYERTN